MNGDVINIKLTAHTRGCSPPTFYTFGTDVPYIGLGKLAVIACLPSFHPAARNRISYIVKLRSQQKMRALHTQWGIALVPNHFAFYF